MTREERELSITYLEEIIETYIEGEGYERHPLPEYYAIENAIKALKQESILDKIRAEIDRQEKWLMSAGYNAYNVDIAFNSIRSVLSESEDKE